MFLEDSLLEASIPSPWYTSLTNETALEAVEDGIGSFFFLRYTDHRQILRRHTRKKLHQFTTVPLHLAMLSDSYSGGLCRLFGSLWPLSLIILSYCASSSLGLPWHTLIAD